MARTFDSRKWTGRPGLPRPPGRTITIHAPPLFRLILGYQILENRTGLTLYVWEWKDAPEYCFKWYRRYSWIAPNI